MLKQKNSFTLGPLSVAEGKFNNSKGSLLCNYFEGNESLHVKVIYNSHSLSEPLVNVSEQPSGASLISMVGGLSTTLNCFIAKC